MSILQRHCCLLLSGILAAGVAVCAEPIGQSAERSCEPPMVETYIVCGSMAFIPLPQIQFDVDKAELTVQARRSLDNIAAYLHDQSHVRRVLIRGHTDSQADMGYNYRLAQERARAVHDYLIQQGISPLQLHLQARGERLPIDENWTPEGRARNRRVELYAIQWRQTAPQTAPEPGGR